MHVIQSHLYWTINLSLILGIINAIMVNIFTLIFNIFFRWNSLESNYDITDEATFKVLLCDGCAPAFMVPVSSVSCSWTTVFPAWRADAVSKLNSIPVVITYFIFLTEVHSSINSVSMTSSMSTQCFQFSSFPEQVFWSSTAAKSWSVRPTLLILLSHWIHQSSVILFCVCGVCLNSNLRFPTY